MENVVAEQKKYRTSSFTANKETVAAMLSKKNIVSTPGVYKANVRVTRPKNPAQKFFWETPTVDETTGDEFYEEYLIANTNLLTEYNAQEAMDLFLNEEYQEAANKGMSARVSLELADQIEAGVGMANVKVTTTLNKAGIEILVINKIVPEKPKEATAFTFDFFKIKEAKEQADANKAIEQFENQATGAAPIIKQKAEVGTPA